MTKILIFMGRYLPGYKDGGPVRSTKNMIDQLYKEYDIRVVCYDRDVGDTEQYPNIRLNSWNKVGHGLVYYIPEGGFSVNLILKLAKQVDVIYLWGCFNYYTVKVLFLKRLGLIKNKVVIAGMGLFSPMAFKMKYAKKKFVVTLFNLLGIFKNVYWSVTSEMEKKEVLQQVWAKDDRFYIAEDLPRIVDAAPVYKSKRQGQLDIVWISRIAPKKNLLQAIKLLRQVNAQITFTIYGPVFDKAYWNMCKKELKLLPSNIKWRYKGNVASEEVVETLKRYHIFLFPTLGENYGHVIQEALSAGCPCILSDQTPWQDLEKYSAGYAFPITEESKYIETIEKYAEMNEAEYEENSVCAWKYAVLKSNEKVKTTGYRNVFKI